MNATDRIETLQDTAFPRTPIEDDLLYGDILHIGPAITASEGHSAPLVVALETGRIAYFKRFADQDPNLCRHYRHHPFDIPVNEVVAWRLAYALGGDSRQLVPTAVMRVIGGAGGALINGVDGKNDLAGVFNAPRQVAAAAFWDALVGNQDRNARNFRYDAQTKRLGLIDHGFVFARPGDFLNHSSLFLAARHCAPAGSPLSTTERGVLERLLDSDLHGARSMLAADRADALEARAERMLRSGCVLPVTSCF